VRSAPYLKTRKGELPPQNKVDKKVAMEISKKKKKPPSKRQESE